MMATQDPPLKPTCASCGGTSDLYTSVCRHMTICISCGKRMAENTTPCRSCGVVLSRLIREYNIKAYPSTKPFFIGRFLQGVPSFSKKTGVDLKWIMHREGLQGRQVTDALREKYKGKPWILNDDQGQQSFQGALEGGQQASYYLLVHHGREFLAMPAGAWYNFHKTPTYKQLTLEEAEEQMKNRRRTADGYQRWLMKAANTGAAAFGEVEKITGGGGGRGGFKRRADDDEEDAAFSDKGEEDADEEEDRKNRLGMNKKAGDEDEEEPARGDDREFDDEEAEKGDDWEHEETFTDDDEAVGNDPEEREDNGPELQAPPEIKQEEEDEEREQEDGQPEKGGLSESGLELKKLLGKTAGLDDSGEDESSDDDNDLDNEDNASPVLAPKRKEGPKEEPVDSTPAKPITAPAGRMAPASTASKGKRKAGTDDSKPSPSASSKKVKTDASQEAGKESLESRSTSPSKPAGIPSRAKPTAPAVGAVTEDDVRAVLRQGPIKSHDLVNKFKSRLATQQDRAAFAAVLKNISRMHKTDGGNFIVLREK
ncbi:hypothetical protein KP509_25G058100 [Ceratopteris richardii]|uniref:Transcription initiation factor IIF subunit alpha n=3 Tax=Ceratopteris richardii TaxID=49495 RepID=A0A8T2RQJ4_CERRI|nr:hypothetical protein KP509_25G058100 [Ceratopteris richardii]